MYDKDARIAKRKDGSTHRAHKAEHAVDLETGAIVAVTLQGADQGDTTTMMETVAEAGEWIAETAAAVNNEADGERVSAEGPQEVVADKGYPSCQGRTKSFPPGRSKRGPLRVKEKGTKLTIWGRL
jgi:transposase